MGSGSADAGVGSGRRTWTCTFTPTFHKRGICPHTRTNDEANAVTMDDCENAGLTNCEASCGPDPACSGYSCEYWANGPQRSLNETTFTNAEAVSLASTDCRTDNSDCKDIVCH
jgi:hypothetical protein